MYIENGIAYAGDPTPPMKVVGVRPLEGHRLWIRFSSGEAKIFDCKPLLETPAYTSLTDEKVFSTVGLDYGVPVWEEGQIDISPEMLYHYGIPI